MTLLLEIRTKMRSIYQKNSMIIDPVFRFIVAFLAFTQINDQVGYDARFSRMSVKLLLSLISALTPWAVMVFLAMALVLAHVYFVSKFLALFILIVFIVLYCFFLRFTPKLGLAVVAIPILTPINLHYAVPMYLGLTQNPLSIIPTACGVLIYNLFSVVKIAAERQVEMSLDDIIGLYTEVIDALLAKKEMLIIMGIFALVIVVIFAIRKFSFDFSFEIALVAGMVINIIGFLIGNLKFGLSVSIGGLILMSLLSAAIVLILYFMKRLLDYTAVERVQFEDDDYYYYVKAVPKINIPEKTHKVKHINKKKAAEEEKESYETDFEIDDFTPDIATRRSDIGSRTADLDDEPVLPDRDFSPEPDTYGKHRDYVDAEEDAYLKGEENFDDFEVDLTLDDDKNTRF